MELSTLHLVTNGRVSMPRLASSLQPSEKISTPRLLTGSSSAVKEQMHHSAQPCKRMITAGNSSEPAIIVRCREIGSTFESRAN